MNKKNKECCQEKEEKKLKKLIITDEIKCLFFVISIIVCSLCVIRPLLQSTVVDATPVVSTKKDLPIYCVGTDEKKVAISFDAAWGCEKTDELLNILDKNNIKATFFLCGYWIDKYPDKVKEIYEKGHTIGNHSNTHPHGNQLSLEQNKAEIMAVHNKIKDLVGVNMQLYRPPFGEYNNTVLRAVRECGYYAIQWDIDSLDWKSYGIDAEVKQVLDHKHLGNGSIILFHNDAKYTPDALQTIIDGLKEKGYEIVPIIELIHKDNYYMDTEGRQISKETLQESSTEQSSEF